MACWAIEISLSGLVSLSESVSLVHVNNNFQTETNSKLMTARCVTPPVQQLLLSDAAFSASNLMHFVVIYNLLQTVHVP